MEQIELVIRIPKDTYEILKNVSERGTGWLDKYQKAIVNGIPLPKGHGALKDFDKIEWYGCNFEGKGCTEAKGDCSVCNHANCYAKQVRDLPTIIEADKEGAEE